MRHLPSSFAAAPSQLGLHWALAGLVCLVTGSCAAYKAAPDEESKPQVRFADEHAAMGTMFRLVMFVPCEMAGEVAAAAAWKRVDEIEAVATDYDAQSESRRLGQRPGEWVPVSDDLAVVLRASDSAWERTAGAFDPTVGVWSKLWRRALRQREWPSEAAWSRAVSAVGWRRQLQLREGERGMEAFVRSTTRLDFGGVAKGVAVDEALDALRLHGVTSALMDGGGDLAALGPPPNEAGWKVAVRPFGDAEDGVMLRFLLSYGAIATSGDAYQGAQLLGEAPSGLRQVSQEVSSRFGHILNPRSLQPLPGPRAAVMTAATASDADAFATALVVLGDLPDSSVPYEGLSKSLRYGIFFASMESDPCVGELFPHHGARLTTSYPARSKE